MQPQGSLSGDEMSGTVSVTGTDSSLSSDLDIPMESSLDNHGSISSCSRSDTLSIDNLPLPKKLESQTTQSEIKQDDAANETCCFFVEMSYSVNAGVHKLLNLSCTTIKSQESQNMPNRVSDMTSYLGDISRTISDRNSYVSVRLPRGPLFLKMKYLAKKISDATSFSSTDSIANCASNLRIPKVTSNMETISPNRKRYLENKWQNSTILYRVLDHVDKYASSLPKRNSSTAEETSVSRKKPRISDRNLLEDLEKPSTSSQFARRKLPGSSISSEGEKSGPKESLLTENITGCDIETNVPYLHTSLKLKKMASRYDKNADDLLGPISPGKWFKGMKFLLTCTNVCTEVNPKVPFIYRRLRNQIVSAGGKIVDDVEKSFRNKNIYLISDRPNYTPKYLKCITLGIQTVSHTWIVSCCKEKKIMPLILLPAGWSIEKSKFIDTRHRFSDKPLLGYQIKIAHSDSSNFFKFCKELCVNLGATALPFKYSNCDEGDLIIAEEGLPNRGFTKSLKLPIVSFNWLIQTVIHGQARGYKDHPSYDLTE